jgi:enediyne biosynthesis protein E4
MRLSFATLLLLFLALGSSCSKKKPAVMQPFLVDVTLESGIRYSWKASGTRPLDLLQTIGNGAAFLDVNGDKNLDILLVGQPIALFQGDGHGHFTEITRSSDLGDVKGHFIGVATADYDNDGDTDIYLSAYRGGALLENQNGKFKNVTKFSQIEPSRFGTACSFVDMNMDGDLDLFIGNYVEFGEGVKRLCRENNILTGCNVRQYEKEKSVFYYAAGNKKFRRFLDLDSIEIGKTLGSAMFFDENGPAIAIANDEMSGNLLYRDARGMFVDQGVVSGIAFNKNGGVHGGMGCDWGDYDNDGKLDLTIATFANETKAIYHNEGNPSEKNVLFQESAALLGSTASFPYVAFGIKWIDADNDGWLDLLIANGHVLDNVEQITPGSKYRQPTLLLRNNGGKQMTDATKRIRHGGHDIVGRGLATGDWDNDGRVDAIVVDAEGEPLLLHNEAPSAGWIGFSLSQSPGHSGGRDAYGALVTVTTGSLKQMRHCHTDGSYLSASDQRLHFGLGNAKKADSVVVRWPDGTIDNLGALESGRYWQLKRGKKPE